MSLLLDTHAVVWLATDLARVPPAVRDAVANAEAVYVSLASAWEYGAKRQKHPRALPRPFEDLIAGTPAQCIGLDYRLCRYSETLPSFHSDPFDRLLIAQALDRNLRLVTRDDEIRKYDVKTLWQV